MLLSIVSVSNISAFASSKVPTTSITSLTVNDNGFTVKWKKKSKITGYQIQYSTSSKFNKKSTKTVKIKKAKTTSKKISDLEPTKKYYVRIRTYKISNKKSNYSTWSKSKSVTTKQEEHCTNNDNHSIMCGNMGKWFNNRNNIVEYYKSEVNKWNNKIDNNEITYNEYLKNVPSGYECWFCSYCGKWTGNFKYD